MRRTLGDRQQRSSSKSFFCPSGTDCLMDIDERKRAEDAIRTSERNFKLIIDTIPALAWSARPDGSAECLNQQYLDFIGLSADQTVEWNWTSADHPDDLAGLAQRWQYILTSGAPGETEARLR